MIMIWILLITNIQGQEVNSTYNNDVAQLPKVTTLYPVSKNISNSTNTITKIEGKTTWNIEATFAESNPENKIEDEGDKNITVVKEEARGINDCKEFKPSQPLATFDEEELTETYGVLGTTDKPGFQFVSSHKNEYIPTFKPSPEDIHTPTEVPYKFDNARYRPQDIWMPDNLEARPTVNVPVRVPAGGLYKLKDPFHENFAGHPNTGYDEKYKLEIKDHLKENYVKKRLKPWKNMIRLVAALIPVGVIISALTPSIITIHNTGPEARHHFMRRSDDGNQMPVISERCRRRLLCELHSEANYKKSQLQRHQGTQCYKIYCEDPQAVLRMLNWLLTYHQPSSDERRRYFT